MSVAPIGLNSSHAAQSMSRAAVARTDRDGDNDNSTAAKDAAEGAKPQAASASVPGLGQHVNLFA